MWPFDLPKEKLDRFGPYGSGLGSLIGSTLFLGSIFLQNPVELIFPFLVPVLSYLLCTCTHRKHRFFSPAAFAGAIGSIIGAIFAGLVGFIFGMATFGVGLPLAIILIGAIIFYTPFYMSRYVCNSYKKKEQPVLSNQVQTYISVYGTLPPPSYIERIPGADIPVYSVPAPQYPAAYGMLPQQSYIERTPSADITKSSRHQRVGPFRMALFFGSTLIPLGIGIYGVYLGAHGGLVWVALVGWGLGIVTSRSNRIWFGAIIGLGFGTVVGALSFLATGWFNVEAEMFSGGFIGGNIGVFVGGIVQWFLQLQERPKTN